MQLTSPPAARRAGGLLDGREPAEESRAAAAECSMLMGVAQNCIGAQSNRPVMGIMQDSLLGLYAMSHTDVLFDHAHACRIIGCARHVARVLPPPALEWTRADGARCACGRESSSCRRSSP